MTEIQLRKVEPTDMMLLYRWVNDPLVRANAFNSNVISLDEHRRWFDAAMNDPNVDIFILTSNGASIGQVRLESTKGIRLIDYSIDEKYRGRGFGKLILRQVEKEIAAGTLVGRVKKDNVASQLIFRSLGYAESEHENYFEYRKPNRN